MAISMVNKFLETLRYDIIQVDALGDHFFIATKLACEHGQ